MSDLFFNLKSIAYHRTALPDANITKEDIINYAKWQICKSRNVLWKDPIWDDYTPEDILVEYFAILFDDNEENKEAFAQKLKPVTEEVYDWFTEMEKKHLTEKIENAPNKGEFEDNFIG